MLEKSTESKDCKACIYERGAWVWTCRHGQHKLIRDYVEVDEIDDAGCITHLANGRRINFLQCSDKSVYDVYLISGTEERILVQKGRDAPSAAQTSPSEEFESELTWE